ncbi:unnamed protein product, partial [marine sediment metagenome]
IIVVDNNSTDGSSEFIKKFKEIKLICLKKNYGASEGKNIGIRNSSGKYIYFLDSDVEVESDCLIRLVEVCDGNENIGICGSKVKSIGTNNIQNAGDFISPVGTLIHRGMNKEDDGSFDEQINVFSVPSCSMLVRKEMLDKLDMWFNPDFFIYFEDTDLCLRANMIGYDVVYVPTSVIYHRNKKPSDIKEESIYMTYRNKIWSFRRNLRFPLKQIMLIFTLITISAGIVLWTLNGKWTFKNNVYRHFFDIINCSLIPTISIKRQ